MALGVAKATPGATPATPTATPAILTATPAWNYLGVARVALSLE